MDLVLQTWSKAQDLGDPRSQREPTNAIHDAKLPSKQSVDPHRVVLFLTFVREAFHTHFVEGVVINVEV